jgi:hypothetical protein
MKALLASVGILVLLGMIVAMTYVTNANYGNRAEVGITAVYDDVQNVYSSFTNQVMEAAQIKDSYADDVEKIIVRALDARYGADGVQSAFSWIQENNPELDSAVYVKIQQIIQSGRKEFQHSQTMLIERKRVYETNLGYVWKGFWLQLAGYPKIDLDDYSTIVSNKTTEAFDSGVDAPLKLN